MKTKSKLCVSLAMCLAFMMGTGFVSCKDDDAPTPEIIENPLDKEAYYITGKVFQDSGVLQGVKVSTTGAEAQTAADGTYLLEVTKKGNYVISFAKEGFVAVTAEAEIAAAATKRSSVSVIQWLAKTNAPVTISADAPTVVLPGTDGSISVDFPAGAVAGATAVSITEYAEGVKRFMNRSSLSSINCQPSGLTFEKGARVTIKNQMSSAIYFTDLAHSAQKDGVWSKGSDITYSAEANGYVAELTGFSSHSFGPACAIAAKGTVTENLATVTIDNLGVMATKEGEVKGKQKHGWEINGKLSDLLASQFPALSSTDLEGLTAMVSNTITSNQGAPAGVTEADMLLGTAKVSGDMKMTVTFDAVVKSTTSTFNFVYQGKPSAITIPVTTYSGVSTKITYQYGASHTDHSGGGGK